MKAWFAKIIFIRIAEMWENEYISQDFDLLTFWQMDLIF